MKKLWILLGCTVLTVAGTLAWASVTVDWDHAADFSSYKTYAWGKGTPARDQLVDQRIVESVDQQLAAKGLQKVDASSNPDLTVLYHAALTEDTQLNTMGTGWGWGWGGGMSTTTVEKIPKGTLSVDIGDAKTKKLLWLGKASQELGDNPQKNAKKIDETIDKMFKKFPPPMK